MALDRETGDRALDCKRVTAREVRRWLGGGDASDAEGLDGLRRRLDAPVIPPEVRSKGREVFDRLSVSGWASTDVESHAGLAGVKGRSLGDLMRESARAAMSWVHANAGRCGVDAAVFRDTDLHAHVQSAAEPRHGPSAGVVLGMQVSSAAISRYRSYDLTLYPLVQV